MKEITEHLLKEVDGDKDRAISRLIGYIQGLEITLDLYYDLNDIKNPPFVYKKLEDVYSSQSNKEL